MKKLKNKKGFTLVELVIVIAVIAVLAAVLIPTFSNLINKANVSRDTQIVRNSNTALALDVEEHKTMYDALQCVKEYGLDITKINAKGLNNEILWDSKNDVFCYYNSEKKDIEYIPGTELIAGEPEDYELWKVADSVPALGEQKYSIYAGEKFKATSVAVKGIGFDAGDNTAIEEITYTGATEGREIVIRSLGNLCVLTVNGELDHVEHYGFAKQINVLAVNSTNSYHEFGTSKELVVTKGKVVIEDTGIVFALKPASGAVASNYTVKNEGGNVLASDITSVPASKIFNIDSLAQFEAFRDATNAGATFAEYNSADKYISLNCDITLTEAWKPISNYSRTKTDLASFAFQGFFNGNGHTISGLTNVGLAISSYNDGSNSSTPEGYSEVTYGLFASVHNAKIMNLTLKNVNIVDDSFGTYLGDCVAALCGYIGGNTTIQGIKVSGSIEGYDSVSGIVGMCRNGASVIENCENNASVYAIRRGAGICGQYGSGITGGHIQGCTNRGSITCAQPSKDYEHKDNTIGTGYYAYNQITNLNSTPQSNVSNNTESGSVHHE